ncbi:MULTISPECIES: flagellar protein FlgN [Pseudobutyrivibrio]|nr:MULTISPECIES: flagellar protein FlgN [unclassified Pseudobutyrivibrio]SCY23388.1 FlgN protein [Pseudobutyrivibrio sp. AR14]MBE5905081.1 flagellar protein FlgN [Pseudobutyrivibrio sp.]MBP5325482.1 flagellar export chaperone FlgN [Pseudobutyrivibrio sp.]MBP5593761.1 flagellar export chaperone FlgN [Pseudobutyrivibrio sp.]MBQ7470334.1 flagellar export chaperone FlgN [Pseudobutyrivibrio sp.]
MASLMEELLLTMDGETEQYEKLISLNDEKKDSIIYKKLDVLEAITVQEQAIADALLELEKKRQGLMQSIAAVMGHENDQITVSWMIDNLAGQPVEQKKLITARGKLREAADNAQILNFQTQNLLRQAIEMVEFDITLLKSVKQAPQTSNYGKNAETTGDLLGNRGFDAKQ